MVLTVSITVSALKGHSEKKEICFDILEVYKRSSIILAKKEQKGLDPLSIFLFTVCSKNKLHSKVGIRIISMKSLLASTAHVHR